MKKNRPQSGSLPIRQRTISKTGHTAFEAQTWYEGLHREGNTSINPFFYGTYLAETKPNEPVTRSKLQAFQADAVGVAHQLTPDHFEKPHTFRVEWQPGKGGRLDWYVKAYRINDTMAIDGDGEGQDWVHVYGLDDTSLSDLMGSQIPEEPSYLIMNTAISSTWGFPYDAPDWCPKCYDCEDPKCACSFYPGFCEMLRSGKVTMLIDSIRVYQSRDPSVHVGGNHTLGCDPPGFPTKEWIDGHSYRYMRNPPFSYEDLKPLRPIQNGGGTCSRDTDCGSDVRHENLTAVYESMVAQGRRARQQWHANKTQGRGVCVDTFKSMVFSTISGKVCSCFSGFTGPHCLSLDHVDEAPSAHVLRMRRSPFTAIANFEVPMFFLISIATMLSLLLIVLITRVFNEKKAKMARAHLGNKLMAKTSYRDNSNMTIVSGTSI